MEGNFHFEKKDSVQKYIPAIVLVLAAIALLYFSAGDFFENKGISPTSENNAAGQGNSVASVSANQNSLELQRKTYGVPLGVFDELPAAPEDFNKMVTLMQQRGYSNYSFFSPPYYLQPEFYPSFLSNGLSYWSRPDPNYYAVAGIGFFPKSQTINLEKGKSATARFFVHAAFGVQSFQGVKLSVERQENAQGITAKILNGEEFLISPSFPKFSSGWARAVDVRIDAAENSSPGSYELKFKIAKPSPEKVDEWGKITGSRYFSTSDAGAEISHTITVNVK